MNPTLFDREQKQTINHSELFSSEMFLLYLQDVVSSPVLLCVVRRQQICYPNYIKSLKLYYLSTSYKEHYFVKGNVGHVNT